MKVTYVEMATKPNETHKLTKSELCSLKLLNEMSSIQGDETVIFQYVCYYNDAQYPRPNIYLLNEKVNMVTLSRDLFAYIYITSKLCRFDL